MSDELSEAEGKMMDSLGRMTNWDLEGEKGAAAGTARGRAPETEISLKNITEERRTAGEAKPWKL